MKSESLNIFISNAGYLIEFELNDNEGSDKSNFTFEDASIAGFTFAIVPIPAVVIFTNFGDILSSSNFSSTSLIFVGVSMKT